MRVVVDTNIVFSAILNTESRIALVLFQSKSDLNFYATEQLLNEIKEHKDKIQSLWVTLLRNSTESYRLLLKESDL